MKLRRQPSSSKRKKDNQGARLIKSLVDYVCVMEERINQLQKAKGVEEKAGAKSGEEETEKEVPETQEPGTEREELLLEMKFFHADGEFDLNGNFLDNIDEKGTYTCETDPKYLIRVLYDWTEDVAQKPPQIVDGELPDPNQIDIIAFGILSEPVAKFFNKQLGREIDTNHLVQFGKPFRPLIRNVQLLRDQLSNLERRFGSVSCPKYAG